MDWELDCRKIFEDCWTTQTAIVSYLTGTDISVSVKSESNPVHLASRTLFGHFKTDPRLQFYK
jgi:hypothetical protein